MCTSTHIRMLATIKKQILKPLKLSLILLTLLSCKRPHHEIIEKFEDNSIKIERIYNDKDAKNEFKYIEYYKNRNIKFEGYIKDNFYRGIKKNYYENGNPMEFCHLTDSGEFNFCCPDGFYELFHTNGKLKQTYYRIKGNIDGIITNYDTLGIKRNELYVENDIKNGLSKHFYSTGVIRSIEQYKNDTLINFVVDFFESGDSSFRANINKGSIYFPIKKWNEEGDYIFGNFLDESEEKVKWVWKNSQDEIIKTEISEANEDGFIIPDFK